jgi:hypothetical protein
MEGDNVVYEVEEPDAWPSFFCGRSPPLKWQTGWKCDGSALPLYGDSAKVDSNVATSPELISGTTPTYSWSGRGRAFGQGVWVSTEGVEPCHSRPTTRAVRHLRRPGYLKGLHYTDLCCQIQEMPSQQIAMSNPSLSKQQIVRSYRGCRPRRSFDIVIDPPSIASGISVS